MNKFEENNFMLSDFAVSTMPGHGIKLSGVILTRQAIFDQEKRAVVRYAEKETEHGRQAIRFLLPGVTGSCELYPIVKLSPQGHLHASFNVMIQEEGRAGIAGLAVRQVLGYGPKVASTFVDGYLNALAERYLETKIGMGIIAIVEAEAEAPK